MSHSPKEVIRRAKEAYSKLAAPLEGVAHWEIYDVIVLAEKLVAEKEKSAS
ncbi:MAG TPA: hypothetical protein VM531_09075 [Sphingomicrobium sp.]|jgi:hypothetical protein|nr:hypothetical protein [Sphingomicrobium sp.]